MLVGLKIDVLSLDAARQLPRLLRLLAEYELHASVFPTLGPLCDTPHGWISRWFCRSKRIDREFHDILLATAQAGHEMGAVAYQAQRWRNEVLQRDASWTQSQLSEGMLAFIQLFDYKPRVIAAAGFMINADVPALELELGLEYAVDTRGLHPYLPMTEAGVGRCPQVPVTLPSIEELVASGESLEDAHQSIFMESQKPLLPGHVFNFTLGEEAHLAVLEKLLVMWMGSKREIVPLRRLKMALDETDSLPVHHVGMIKNAAGHICYAVQGESVAHV